MIPEGEASLCGFDRAHPLFTVGDVAAQLVSPWIRGPPTHDMGLACRSPLPPDSLLGSASQPPGLSVIPGRAGEAMLSPLFLPQADPCSSSAGERREVFCGNRVLSLSAARPGVLVGKEGLEI